MNVIFVEFEHPRGVKVALNLDGVYRLLDLDDDYILDEIKTAENLRSVYLSELEPLLNSHEWQKYLKDEFVNAWTHDVKNVS